MRIVIAAGGTGGHIFPALSVAHVFQERHEDVSLLWIGTTRSRERELCERYGIPIKTLNVRGIKRALSRESIAAVLAFAHEVTSMRSHFSKEPADAIVAFGGYVCAPVLAAARLKRIPYFLQEQNTVPGLVNRLFAKSAEMSFLGFPLSDKWQLKGPTRITGTPVRQLEGDFSDFEYPEGFDRTQKGILICGGSQGAASMNRGLIAAVKKILKSGIRVVWQTGKSTFGEVLQQMEPYSNAFVFESFDDLYPYYATAKLVIGRSGASTLGETAYFGLPSVLIPLPWAAENHQWMNAGLAEIQGRAIRVAQDEKCSDGVFQAVDQLMNDNQMYLKMCQKALDHTPANAASDIVREIVATVETKKC